VKYLYHAVDRLPKVLDEGVVYHSQEFEVGAFLCACGCGHRVSLLVPDSHQVTSEAGLATVRPSISVCDAPCKSHYFISAGEVRWMPAFSESTAAATMRSQIARHAAPEEAVRIEVPQSWIGRARTAIVRGFVWLRSVLGL
jgi:hypothetical protein